MKTLFLLRHAKSSWSEPGLADFNRPLNERGRRAAPLIARYLAHCDLLPDLILCSAALRTRETLALMLPGLPAAPSCASRAASTKRTRQPC